MRQRLAAVLVCVAMATMPLVAVTAGSKATIAQDQGPDAADRETDRVTFYGSLFGHGLFEPMPMNTLYPEGEENLGIGYLAQCGPGPAVEGCEEASWNKVAFYSSPGPVDIENREEFLQGGQWGQLHNERGQTTQIHLDEDETLQASIYFTYSLHGWPVGWENPHGTNCIYPHPKNMPCVWPSWRWHPGAFDDVVMSATLYASDLGEMHGLASDPPPIEERLQDGDVRKIAHGQWGPETVIHAIPGFPMAAYAEIDLGTPESGTIEQHEDFFVVFSSYQETAGEKYNIGSPLRWYSGEFFPPTFEMPVKNAITVERVLPNFVHGQLALVSVVNMPWGSYDVSDGKITFDVKGPSGGTVDIAKEHARTLDIEQSLAHGGHYQPVNKTLIWDYQSDDAVPGTYKVTVTATNLQGSSTHSCTATFELDQEDERLVPGGVEVGLCGEQTLGEGELEDVVGDIEEEADDE